MGPLERWGHLGLRPTAPPPKTSCGKRTARHVCGCPRMARHKRPARASTPPGGHLTRLLTPALCARPSRPRGSPQEPPDSPDAECGRGPRAQVGVLVGAPRGPSMKDGSEGPLQAPPKPPVGSPPPTLPQALGILEPWQLQPEAPGWGGPWALSGADPGGPRTFPSRNGVAVSDSALLRVLWGVGVTFEALRACRLRWGTWAPQAGASLPSPLRLRRRHRQQGACPPHHG